MGFLDLINRGRSTIGMGLARAGSVIRKVGDVSAPTIRKVGQISGILSKVAPVVGMALAPATAGLSLGLGAGVGKALGAVSNVASHAGDIASGISKFGSRLETAGQSIGGFPQGSQPYASPMDVMVGRTNSIPMAPKGMSMSLPSRR